MSIRINKFLGQFGFTSRREADKLILDGRVTVNNKIIQPGYKVDENDVVKVDGEKIKSSLKKNVYLAFNKPKGIVCTTDTEKEENNIIDYINFNKRIFPIGRLDKLSEGLILLTNDGDIVNKILRSRFKHEKEYLVTLNKKLTKDFLKKMENGVPILNTTTRKCKTTYINEFQFKIVLTQGLNRQIRRMCEHFEYRVKKLERIRIINIKLDIPRGKWRYLTVDEVKFLKNSKYFYMRKIIIANTIIFFLFQISTAQQKNIKNDTLVLDEVTIESVKIPLKEKKSLYPITQINFKDYQSLTPQINISEFLESVPGLFILNNNNYAQDARISIRGFGSRANFGVRGIKIYVDGIPETSADGQSQTDNINLEIIEKVEVFRGNNSSLFGSSSGGAISITTFEDFKKDFINVGYSLGSFNTSKKQATIGLVNKNEKMTFFISNTKSSGYRSHSGYENFNMNFKYIKPLNANNKLQLIANFLNSPSANDPGGLNLDEVKNNRSEGRSRNIQYDAGEKVKQYKVGLNFTSIIRKLQLSNSVYYNQRLFDGKLPFGSGGIIDLNRAFWGYKLNINIQGYLNYDLGFSYNNQKDDRQRFFNDEGIKADQVMGQNENYENTSLYFFGSKSLGKLNFSGGARFENNVISLESYFKPLDKKTRRINSFNPSVNFLYEFDKIDVFANFSSGYETPTLNELSATSNQTGFNNDLKNIKSNTFEIGFANLKNDNIINYSIRLFNISTINEITPYQLNDGLVLYSNAGKTTKKGAEVEFNGKISDQLNFEYAASIGNYKFESFKFNENDFSNNLIPGIPKSQHNIKIKYKNESNFNLVVGLKRLGKMFADNANKTEIDGYSSINVKMSKNLNLFKTSITPFISIDNLFNKEYFDNIRINAFGSRFYEPAPGINFIGGLKLNL